MSDEQDWAQPPYRGLPLVVAILVVSMSVTSVMLLPIVDGLRRALAIGFLVALIALQLPLVIRAWRAGRRPLSPRWMRFAGSVSWFWGFFTAWMYLLLSHEPAVSSALSGSLAALFFGVYMWFVDPSRSRGSAPRPGADSRSSNAST